MKQENFILYEHGFGEVYENRSYQRPALGKALSTFVANQQDNLVLAIDGGWGSGKTHFLQRWVGAHCLENDHVHDIVIYVDAHEGDYANDPLQTVFTAIYERTKELKTSTKIDKVMGYAYDLVSSGWRVVKPSIGHVVATGATIAAGLPVPAQASVDEAVANIEEKLAGRKLEFWDQSTRNKRSIAEIKNALAEFISELPNKKLILVVDELDRCKPDYAIDFIEIIKHILSVKALHTIIGININGFENMITHRYGNIQTSQYIEKYIPYIFKLPTEADNGPTIARQFLEHSLEKSGIDQDDYQILLTHLDAIKDQNILSMRHSNTILQRCMMLEQAKRLSNLYVSFKHMAFIGTIIYVLKPQWIEGFRNHDANTYSSVSNFFEYKGSRNGHTPEGYAALHLDLFLNPERVNKQSNNTEDHRNIIIKKIPRPSDWPKTTTGVIRKYCEIL